MMATPSGNIVCSVAFDLGAVALGKCDFLFNGNLLGIGVKLGFAIGEAVDSRDDIKRRLFRVR